MRWRTPRNREQHREQREIDKGWQQWFAWFPVMVSLNHYAWLEVVERRRTYGKSYINDYRWEYFWEYRRPGSSVSSHGYTHR